MVEIKVDTRELVRALGSLKSEVPFATARGINDTLLRIQQDEIKDINDRFTVRKPGFVKRSVKITKFAKKQDLVGSIAIADIGGKRTADILGKFEEGGVKTPKGGNHIAVPHENIRGGGSRLVSARNKPSHLKNSFKVNKGTKAFIFQRKGKGKNARVQLAYILTPSAKIDGRLRFIDIGVQTFNREFQNAVNTRLEQAIATARLRK